MLEWFHLTSFWHELLLLSLVIETILDSGNNYSDLEDTKLMIELSNYSWFILRIRCCNISNGSIAIWDICRIRFYEVIPLCFC
jgi:hypothetical protein